MISLIITYVIMNIWSSYQPWIEPRNDEYDKNWPWIDPAKPSENCKGEIGLRDAGGAETNWKLFVILKLTMTIYPNNDDDDNLSK